MATQPPVSATATADAGNEDEKGKGFLVWLVIGVGILCLLLGIGAGYGIWHNPAKVGNLELDKQKLEGELKAERAKVTALEARKPTEIVQGLTAEQCTKMADDIVGKSCVGKTVAGPIRWRTPPAQVAGTPPAGPGPGRVAVRGAAVDHCVFRIHGKIMAETDVPEGLGKEKCPVWRDEMLAKYNKNPKDLIWAKQYPSNSRP